MAIDVFVDAETKITTIAETGTITSADLQRVRHAIGGPAEHAPRLVIDLSQAELKLVGDDVRQFNLQK